MDTIIAEIGEPKIVGMREKLSAYVELTKPRIAFLLVLTSAAGFYLGTTGTFDLALFANSMVAITLLAFGVATLNQFWERDIDPLMKRTAPEFSYCTGDQSAASTHPSDGKWSR